MRPLRAFNVVEEVKSRDATTVSRYIEDEGVSLLCGMTHISLKLSHLMALPR